MRHRVGQRKLGRVTEHRIAMLRNQAEALIRHERIETTVPKAKELRPFVERIITIAKRGLAAGDAHAGSLHARRLVLRDIQNRDVVAKLFDTIAPLRRPRRPSGSSPRARASADGCARRRTASAARPAAQRVQKPRAPRGRRRRPSPRARNAAKAAARPTPAARARRRRRREKLGGRNWRLPVGD